MVTTQRRNETYCSILSGRDLEVLACFAEQSLASWALVDFTFVENDGWTGKAFHVVVAAIGVVGDEVEDATPSVLTLLDKLGVEHGILLDGEFAVSRVGKLLPCFLLGLSVVGV